ALAMARTAGAQQANRWCQQLQRASRQQALEHAATLTRRLAHDFGNVLTGILGFSELALSQNLSPTSALNRHITEVYRSAQAGATLTNQLRLFSRRQASSVRPGHVALALHEEEGRLRSMPESTVRYESGLPGDLPPVMLDQEHLRHVLGALLDNAREASNGQG